MNKTLKLYVKWQSASMEQTEHGYLSGGYVAILGAPEPGARLLAEVQAPSGVDIIRDSGVTMLAVPESIALAIQPDISKPPTREDRRHLYTVSTALFWGRAGIWPLLSDTGEDLQMQKAENARRVQFEKRSRDRDSDRTPYMKGDDLPA